SGGGWHHYTPAFFKRSRKQGGWKGVGPPGTAGVPPARRRGIAALVRHSGARPIAGPRAGSTPLTVYGMMRALIETRIIVDRTFPIDARNRRANLDDLGVGAGCVFPDSSPPQEVLL